MILDAGDERAAKLAVELSRTFGAVAAAAAWQHPWSIPAETQIVVHAAEGADESENEPLPLRVESLRPELLVADTSLHGRQSWLLDQAIRRGCKTVNGLSVLIEQIAVALQRWTAVEPSRPVLRDAAEEFLGL